jgi:hypothetical protein
MGANKQELEIAAKSAQTSQKEFFSFVLFALFRGCSVFLDSCLFVLIRG